MQHNQQSIGIFDSGIGGLTVAKAINKLMPNESFIYFGDTAHLPYGDKSASAIKSYSKKIASFLIASKCKAIVIACNTASSVAYKSIKNSSIPIIDVINPLAEYIAKEYKQGKIGVIATKGTIKSEAYKKTIKKNNPKLLTVEVATPLLAPMIEEGFYNHSISKTIINGYLKQETLKDINALVLGCTHYPLIKKEIKEYYKSLEKKVEVVDGAAIVAKHLKDVLARQNLLSDTQKNANRFCVSDYTDAFEKTAKIFFGEEIQLEHFPIWQQ